MIRGNLAYERGDGATAVQHYAAAIAVFRTFRWTGLTWYLGQYGLAQLSRQLASCSRSRPRSWWPCSAICRRARSRPSPSSACWLLALELGDTARVETLAPPNRPFPWSFPRCAREPECLGRSPRHSAIGMRPRVPWRPQRRPPVATTCCQSWGRSCAPGEAAQARGGATAESEAARLCAAAIALYEQLGKPDAMVARLRPSRERAARRCHPHTSSRRVESREVEVLRLVVAGKSDGEIAQTLIISEKTVAEHLAEHLCQDRCKQPCRRNSVRYPSQSGLE